MSPRYYLISGIIVFALTLIISWWKQTRSTKEVFVVFFQVVMLLAILFCGVVGLAELLAYLGVAQSAFIFQQEELR